MKRSLPYIWALPIAILVAYAAVVAYAVTVPERACARCHDTVAQALSDGTHAGVECYACHGPAGGGVLFAGSRLPGMYVASIISTGPTGPVSETAAARCLTCHAAVMDRVTEGARGLKIDHSSCARTASCDSCHSTAAHGDAVRWRRLPVMEQCTSCHRREKAPLECTSCHVGDISEEYRLESGPWQVTHGPQWRSAHGMGDLDSCSTCHAEDYCTRCHEVEVPHSEGFGSRHGAFATSNRSACMTCHKSERFCDSCHGTKMPHAPDYLKRHASHAGELENPVCQRCHSVTDCKACHERHVHPGNAKNLLSRPQGGGDGL